MMMRQSGAETVRKYGQKLGPWAGTWVPFPCSEFSQNAARVGGSRADRVSQLGQGGAGIPTEH